MNAPLSAPAEVPTIRSGRMSRSYRASSIPTWMEPRLAPPESTNAVVTDQSFLRHLPSVERCRVLTTYPRRAVRSECLSPASQVQALTHSPRLRGGSRSSHDPL